MFAPTNEAFARMPDWAKHVNVNDLIKYHVARGDYLEKELKDNQLIRTLLSKRDVRINIYKGRHCACSYKYSLPVQINAETSLAG